jgi:hypothetical protein
MKINKFAILAFVSCLNVCGKKYKFDDLAPQLMAEHGIHKTQSGYVINLDRFVPNLRAPYREFLELNKLQTQGNIPVEKIRKEYLDFAGFELFGNDLIIDMELAAGLFEPKQPYNSIYQIAMDDALGLT